MRTKKQSWNIFKPLLIMCLSISGIIVMLHAATGKTQKKEQCSGSNCKKVSADVLNVINVKLM